MSQAIDFGQVLRQARELRGLTPEELANETHIPLAHIEALESGQLDAMPGGLYRRAEARAYAEAVGLEPTMVLSDLQWALTAESVAGPMAPLAATSFADAESLLRSPEPLKAPASTLSRPRQRDHPRYAPARPEDPRRRWRFTAALVLGSAAMLWEQSGSAPTITGNRQVAEIAGAFEAASMLDDMVRIVDAPRAAPGLSRTLFAEGPQPAGSLRREARLAASGRLVVRSTPPGARVTVNGVGWGETPVAIRYLPFGTVRVRVVKENHRAQERVVELTASNPANTLRVTLPAIPIRRAAVAAASGPMLIVTTSPPGARVTVNGIGFGQTPVEIRHLPPRVQTVRVVKDDYTSAERVVQVTQGQSRKVSIPLEPIR